MGRLFKRNLNKCGQEITLQNRSIQSPLFGTSDFDERFSDDISRQAIVKTPRGKTWFDGVSTETTITHEICLAYESGVVDELTVTAETWALLKGRRLDILNVKNCCEHDETLVLYCADRGLTAKAATKS